MTIIVIKLYMNLFSFKKAPLEINSTHCAPAPFVISTKSLRAHWCQTLFQSLINQPVGHVLQPTEVCTTTTQSHCKKVLRGAIHTS